MAYANVPYNVPIFNLAGVNIADPASLAAALQTWSNDMQQFLQQFALNANLQGRSQQFGTATASSAGVVVPFPTPFVSECSAIFLQLQGSGAPAATTLAAEILNNEEFKAFSSVAGPVNVWFMAVGE